MSASALYPRSVGISTMQLPSLFREEFPRVVVLDKLNPAPYKHYNQIGLEKRTNENYYLKNQNPNNPFFAKKINKQFIWMSGKVDQYSHIREIVNALLPYGQSFLINTGTHGDSNGLTANECGPDIIHKYADSYILNQDINGFKDTPNVSIRCITSIDEAAFHEKANHVFLAWCFSEKTWETKYAGVVQNPSRHPKSSSGVFLHIKCSCKNKEKRLGESGRINVFASVTTSKCNSCNKIKKFKVRIWNASYKVDYLKRTNDLEPKRISLTYREPHSDKYKFDDSYIFFEVQIL